MFRRFIHIVSMLPCLVGIALLESPLSQADPIPEKLLSTIQSEDLRRAELICTETEYNPRDCRNGFVRFISGDRVAGETELFRVGSVVTLLTRDFEAGIGLITVDEHQLYDSVFPNPVGAIDFAQFGTAPGKLKMSSRMFDRFLQSILKTLPHSSQWKRPLESGFSGGDELKCLPEIPRRHIGRGIVEPKSGKMLSLDCLDDECRSAAILFSEKNGCQRKLGAAFEVRTESVQSIQDSLMGAISDRFHFADQIELMKQMREYRPLPGFKWKSIAPELVRNLIDPQALASVVAREVHYWQFKPREVDAGELNRWLYVFADAPYLYSTHSFGCRLGQFSFDRDSQQLTRFIDGLKIDAFEGLDTVAQYSKGVWTEETINTFRYLVRPLFTRYAEWEASAYFVQDPREEYADHSVSISIDMYRWGHYSLSYRASTTDDQKRDRFASASEKHARRDGQDLPSIIAKIARKLHCD